MAKTTFQDVVPPEKRSIRNIPITRSAKRKAPVIITPKIETIDARDIDTESDKENIYQNMNNFETDENINIFQKPVSNISSKISELTEKRTNGAYEYYYPKTNKDTKSIFSNKRKFFFGGIGVIFILGFIFLMMTILASAKVTILVKNQDLNIEAMPLVASIGLNGDNVKYEVIKISKKANAKIKATGEEMVENKASGKIIIYNNFSTEPQRLIVRTRFESTDGLLYRIPESVIVPGKVVKNGISTPGSIEVLVFADEAGEKYNIKKTDFKIPGFKNDAIRYKEFYARSSTEMEGGFIGKMKTVSQTEKEQVLSKIESDLISEITKEIETKLPKELVFLKDSIVYSKSELPKEEDGNDVSVGTEMTALVILLDKETLSKNIIAKYKNEYPDWQNIEAKITDFSKLSIVNKPLIVDDGLDMNISISGQTKMEALIDPEKIKNMILGLKRKDLYNTLTKIDGVVSIKAAIKPMWKQSFPKNPSKINVSISTDE